MSYKTCPWALLVATLACGPEAPSTSDSAGQTTTTSATTDPGDTTTTAPPDPTTTTSATSEASTGAGFIAIPDGGGDCLESSADPTLRCSVCDFYTQDCPRGEKCNPFSEDGDDAWDHQRCYPIDSDPGAPGEPCTVEGSVASGFDSCDRGAMCWDIDPVTLTGTCVSMCQGSPDAPICDPGRACHIANDGVLNLCLPTCDPLLQDCDATETCIPTASEFVCRRAPDPAAQLFAACHGPAACVPGLLCTSVDLAPACDPDQPGCCLPYCDLTIPTCPPDLQCLPWYDLDQAPAGLENTGLCRLLP